MYVVCLTTESQPVSSINFQYPVVALVTSSSFLRLPPRLPVTYMPPPVFRSVLFLYTGIIRNLLLFDQDAGSSSKLSLQGLSQA